MLIIIELGKIEYAFIKQNIFNYVPPPSILEIPPLIKNTSRTSRVIPKKLFCL